VRAERAESPSGAKSVWPPAVWGLPVILVVTLGPAVVKFVQVLAPVVH
jgi:hypothetical protein